MRCLNLTATARPTVRPDARHTAGPTARNSACTRTPVTLVLAAAVAGLLAFGPCRAQAPVPAPAGEPVFDVLEFEVEGNSVLAVTAVEAAVLPHLGPQRGMAAVEAARGALEQAYQRAGYLSVLVDIPEQRVDGGLVRLRVTEGRVDRLRITNARFFAQGWIRDKVPALAAGQVPNFNEVQAQLATVNRSDDRRVQPLLRPGAAPGTLEAELRVEDKLPVSGSVELHNRHAKDTVPWRLTATVRHDNLFQREHSLTVSATTAPENTRQAQVLVLNYSVPADDGGAWLASLVHSNSLTEPLGASVTGKGNTLSLKRALPLPGSGPLSQGLTLGIDFKDLQQQVRNGADGIATPLRYAPAVADWNGFFGWTRSSLQANATLSAALRSVGGRTLDCAGLPTDQFECSRRGADGSFAVLRLDLRPQWKLDAQGWLLQGRLGLQRASGPLASGEQYVLGGVDSVRGYRESAATGDNAWLTSAELRSPNWAARLGSSLGLSSFGMTELVASAFVDAGHVQTLEPAVGQDAAADVYGAGLGLQWRWAQQLDGAFSLAWPLHRLATQTGTSPRLHARVALRF